MDIGEFKIYNTNISSALLYLNVKTIVGVVESPPPSPEFLEIKAHYYNKILLLNIKFSMIESII